MDYDRISKPEYWRAIVSQLSITESGKDKSALFPGIDTDLDDELRERLVEEGYIQFNEVIPMQSVNKLKESILTLRANNWLPLFGFIYDEFWETFYGFRRILKSVLGDDAQMLPDFWIWYVDPVKQESGWGPHRDKTSDSLLPDGMPKSLTVWVPLTEATPLNGCMYLIPANQDNTYRDFEKNLPPTGFQSVRALPAKAGTVFLWNQRVFHWGGRSSKYAHEPRISMAFEFQRGDIPAYNKPLLDMSVLPTFEQRLKLIGKQILHYTHMYNYSDELVELAKRMTGRDTLVPTRPPIDAQTANRNAPCPCGSGKKYKHCHGRL